MGNFLNRREHHTFDTVNKSISGNCPQFLIVILIRVYLNVQPHKVNIFIYLELEQRLQNKVLTIMVVLYIINLNIINAF